MFWHNNPNKFLEQVGEVEPDLDELLATASEVAFIVWRSIRDKGNDGIRHPARKGPRLTAWFDDKRDTACITKTSAKTPDCRETVGISYGSRGVIIERTHYRPSVDSERPGVIIGKSIVFPLSSGAPCKMSSTVYDHFPSSDESVAGATADDPDGDPVTAEGAYNLAKQLGDLIDPTKRLAAMVVQQRAIVEDP